MNQVIVLLILLITACSHRPAVSSHPAEMPIAVSNNAVAYLNINDQHQYYTFNGLTAGKSYQDITNRAFVWQSGEWQELDVPDSQLPVLASVAVALNGSVYLFGGYTVAEDHSEKSVPNVWKINGLNQHWSALPPMPTPVDDAVALVYADRYIYLISGWHDVDNVDLVQVLDTETEQWLQATAFPLPPVFGHAGGIIGNHMVICDGVKVLWQGEKKEFLPSPACAKGTISPNDVTHIDWQVIDHHSGIAYYRMAANDDGVSSIYFAAGSDNPYNYDGIGYNKAPSNPSSDVRVFDTNELKWSVLEDHIPASMDHRSLLRVDEGFMILGGMGHQQQVLQRITQFKISATEAE